MSLLSSSQGQPVSLQISFFMHHIISLFFSQIKQSSHFFPFFFFPYRQGDGFVSWPPWCVCHSQSCHIVKHKMSPPLQAPNSASCRWKPLHTRVLSLGIQCFAHHWMKLLRVFFPQKPISFTNFCDFIFFLVLEGLRGDIIHVCCQGCWGHCTITGRFQKRRTGASWFQLSVITW